MKQAQSTSKYHSLDPREQYERSIIASENPHSIIVDEIGTPNYL